MKMGLSWWLRWQRICLQYGRPGSGISPGKGNGNPLQYSCLENPMDRGAWQDIVHEVSKSQDMTEQQYYYFFNEDMSLLNILSICSIKNFTEQTNGHGLHSLGHIQYLFCYWNCSSFHHWKLRKVGSCILLTWTFLSTFLVFFFLLSGTTKFLGLFFYLPHPSCEINYFSKNFDSFYWRMIFSNEYFSVRCD